MMANLFLPYVITIASLHEIIKTKVNNNRKTRNNFNPRGQLFFRIFGTNHLDNLSTTIMQSFLQLKAERAASSDRYCYAM